MRKNGFIADFQSVMDLSERADKSTVLCFISKLEN